MDSIFNSVDLFIDTQDNYEFTVNANFSKRNVNGVFKLNSDIKEFLKNSEKINFNDKDIEKEFGKKLYDLLFKDEIKKIYDEINIQSKVKSVTIKLNFSENAIELLGLPWELLHDGNRFLIASGKVNLVRYLANAESNLMDVLLPLRILIIISRPLNVAELDKLIEGEAVVKGLYSLKCINNVIIDFLNPPTHDSLVKALDNKEYHIIHFDGHGTFQSGNGYLAFENEHMELDLINSDIIFNIFSNTKIKLIVLTACQSSKIEKNIFNSISTALIQAGIPNVVAMQFSITLESAVKFAEQFYNSLSSKNNLINSVMQGRKIIYRNNSWFIPTLYSSNLTDENFINNDDSMNKLLDVPSRPIINNQYYEPNFVGRSEQLIKLSKAISSSKTNCIVLWGSGGIGKTSILKQFILRQQWRFTDEVIWIDLRGGKHLNNIIVQICSNLNIDCNSENLISIVNHNFESKRLLIVFDNFEDVENDEEILEFIKLIPRPSRVIISARNNPLVLKWKKIQLYKLNLEESIELFSQLAESMDVLFNESDTQSIEEVCKVIDGHPLALTLIARMLLSNSLDTILNKIKTNPLKGIGLALDVSYNDLNELEKKMITRLSVFDSYFDEEGIKFVSNIDDYEIIKDELIRCSFIHFNRKKFSIHPVIKQYVYDKLTNKKNYHINAAKYYQSKKYYFQMVDQFYYAKEWRDFAASMQQLLRPLSIRSMPSLGDVLKRIDMLNNAVEKIGDDIFTCEIYLDIAELYQQTGMLKKALEKIDEAYNVAKESNNPEGKCQSLAKKLQAYSANFQKEESEILEVINDVESLIKVSNNEIVIINSLLCCADAYLILGIKEGNDKHTKKAISQFKKAKKLIEVQDKTNDEMSFLIAQCYHSIGIGNEELKNDNIAIICFNKSIEIKRTVNDLFGISVTLGALSNLYEKLGMLKEAKECLKEILELCKKMNFSNLVEYQLLKLGKISIILEEYEDISYVFSQTIIKSLDSKDDSIEYIMDEIENELIALSKKEGVAIPGFIIGFLKYFLTDDKCVGTLPQRISNKLPLIVQQIDEIPKKIDLLFC